jgi:hypothetical protein
LRRSGHPARWRGTDVLVSGEKYFRWLKIQWGALYLLYTDLQNQRRSRRDALYTDVRQDRRKLSRSRTRVSQPVEKCNKSFEFFLVIFNYGYASIRSVSLPIIILIPMRFVFQCQYVDQ